jgi:lipopolysaccharide transport system permease protein
MIYYRVPVSWLTLYALPIVIVLIAFASAIALFLSSIQVRFRDVAAALPAVLQAGVFTAPVVYPLDAVPLRLRHLYLLNPVASLIENFRRVVLGSSPNIRMLTSASAITICCLVLAYGYFKVTESTMSDVI